MSEAPARRWGPWATALWAGAVMALFVAVQTAFAAIYLAATLGPRGAERAAREIERVSRNGDVLAATTFLSTPVCLLVLFAAVKWKRGATLEDSFALRLPEPRVLVRWMLAVLAFAALSDGFTWLLGKPIVPEFMAQVYRSADDKGALWLALVAGAPLFEEVFFRGFVISGLARRRLGASGAVIVSSALWAAIHMQYDTYGIATVFVAGLLLGAARVRTSSVATPLAMHMALNLIATAEAAFA